jgi:hypothetical protein
MLFCILFALYCLLCFFGWSLVRVSAKATTQSRKSEPLYSPESSDNSVRATQTLTTQAR